MAGPRLVVATTNRHKLREIRAVLDGLGTVIDGLDAFPPVAEPEETGATFAENARQKAVYYSSALGVPVVAEDSGLEIDGLGGEPGVRSARYGGPDRPAYEQKFALVYAGLRDRGASGSPARFVCALTLADGARVVFEALGTIEGRIADEPAGAGGFGYDPIFFYPPLGRTLAQLDEREKAGVSHRGRAFRQLRAFLASGGPLRGE
ncbi:MAG TPA: RdgB/HAM1 family non-canonical purine NTP pyrophosphatase [Vicinamibacterales bacterium]|nr:RdgB/HAM1 family non-canonical purine NTP pyrophosphatase [Vicinamibacterales bacterium]HPK70846.1 RdgB/HAM1 family non-canonical purine NTP pyrophosphatase [Vicinamibacterales bacterium]HPW21764.1 RdgB/HAM1 family non-canonical purine NTP pyrophosphatase [Vicinamibacterales bacterium]